MPWTKAGPTKRATHLYTSAWPSIEKNSSWPLCTQQKLPSNIRLLLTVMPDLCVFFVPALFWLSLPVTVLLSSSYFFSPVHHCLRLSLCIYTPAFVLFVACSSCHLIIRSSTYFKSRSDVIWPLSMFFDQGFCQPILYFCLSSLACPCTRP